MSKCILIVDDSKPVRTATRFFLESQPGFEVCGEAVDGVDALEQARQLSPDLIILDLQMPRLNGLQAARELRARCFRAPIILFTLFAEAIQSQDAKEAGVNAVVSKTDLGALLFHLQNLLLA
ncbi:MAG: hypothetical protein PVS2B2_16430 [Candidatus Acidiferrum sp.]